MKTANDHQDDARATTASRVVVITGGSSGIGRATALRYARDTRVHLVLVSRRGRELEATLELAGAAGRGRIIEADLSNPSEAARIAADIEAHEGRCDVLVNNAGASCDIAIGEPGYVDAAMRVLHLNLATPIALTSHLLPLLARSRGTVVNVSSVAGLFGVPGSAAYSASKFGLTGFSQALESELAGRGVRVCAVHPGPVPTPGWPQERMVRSRWRHLFASDVDRVARRIERAAAGRGSPMPVEPRSYSLVHRLTALSPAAGRFLLRLVARRRARSRAPG